MAEGLISNSCFGHSCFPDRYQPELFRFSKDLEMLEINGSEEEKMTINSTAGDGQNAFKEKCSCRSLFFPSEDTPTHVSGRIVYISTTAVGRVTGEREKLGALVDLQLRAPVAETRGLPETTGMSNWPGLAPLQET